jgi:outer membrane beta-barrel protein
MDFLLNCANQLMTKKQRLIASILLAMVSIIVAAPSYAQSRGLAVAQVQDESPDIDPNVERRDIKEFDIDSENIEVSAFVGVISIEDFESNVVYGARLAYHINENLFIEGTYGAATAGETSFEVLSGGAPFLTDDQRDYTYYDASVGYNFNGELFVTDSLVFNTDLYLTLGAGSTDFGGDERFTISVGAGYRMLFTDYFAVRLDVRDHMFKSDIIGEEKNVQNLTYTISTSFFF